MYSCMEMYGCVRHVETNNNKSLNLTNSKIKFHSKKGVIRGNGGLSRKCSDFF